MQPRGRAHPHGWTRIAGATTPPHRGGASALRCLGAAPPPGAGPGRASTDRRGWTSRRRCGAQRRRGSRRRSSATMRAPRARIEPFHSVHAGPADSDSAFCPWDRTKNVGVMPIAQRFTGLMTPSHVRNCLARPESAWESESAMGRRLATLGRSTRMAAIRKVPGNGLALPVTPTATGLGRGAPGRTGAARPQDLSQRPRACVGPGTAGSGPVLGFLQWARAGSTFRAAA
jgi:hypothetical protein